MYTNRKIFQSNVNKQILIFNMNTHPQWWFLVTCVGCWSVLSVLSVPSCFNALLRCI